MNFEKAFRELMKGKKIRRKEWEPLMHISLREGKVKTYQGEYTHFYNDSNILVSTGWIVIDGDGKELTFIEALEELKAKKKITNKSWLESGEPHKFLFIDDNQFTLCQAIEFEFMPTYQCLISTDWEIMP
jgi:hypothetical protein